MIHDGDMVSILASPVNAAAFFKKIGLKTNQVKNAIIVGGGTISYYLTKALLDMNISVKIIEQNESRCETLSDLLPEATIINGDGTNRSLLMEEGLSRTEAFVSLTNMDEENVFLSLFAKTVSNAKLVAKVNRLAFDDVIDNLDIGSVIYPKYITADYILQYVRAMQNSIGSNIETLYHILDNQAEALEFAIRENSPVTGIPLSELNLKKNLTCRLPEPKWSGQDSPRPGYHSGRRYRYHSNFSEGPSRYHRYSGKIKEPNHELFHYYLYHRNDSEN